MTTDPDQIRTQVAALLAELPELTPESQDDATIATMDNAAQRLAQAHDVLVAALESVEKD